MLIMVGLDLVSYDYVYKFIIGLHGGIINGRFLPGDENEKGLKEVRRTDPKYQPSYSYVRNQFHMICLPLMAILKVKTCIELLFYFI